MPRKKYKHNGYAGNTNLSLQTQLKPKTVNQSKYLNAIDVTDVIFCAGPAGSGKTAIAVACACQYLIEKRVEKIVIARPTVESGKGLGHLPGTYTTKIQPYLVPILEEMSKYFTPDALHSLCASNTVELCPLEYMRGRNFHHTFMILDEAQNATFDQIKMFITRMGQESKVVLNGDPEQVDLGIKMRGGFDFCMQKLSDVDGIAICSLGRNDIIRNDMIGRILSQLNS